ncbi:MAG: hypothetical protein JSU80_11980 [Deltaproteobacteria bacterium]|nr:MAG: hypothetical protein JSU80_11980 [Deltaproteobacteria bacterium]
MARTVSKTESFVGYAVILLLVIITGGIFFKQAHFDPSVLKPAFSQQELSTQPLSTLTPPQDLLRYAPQNLILLSPVESFGPENLSDKINGKAELYLSGGFVRLVSQRFAIEDEPDAWMEAFIYDMGSPRGSYAVYSLQKRFEAKELELGDYGYGTENGLYFVHGPYYLEIVSSVAQERMAELMLSFGRNFISKTPVESNDINELALFPEKNLNKESISLIPSNGFGFEQFDSIFTAQYVVGDTELTAFLSRRKSQAEATRLVESYTSFLTAVGGTELKPNLNIPGAKLVEIMDTFELFFSRGSILAGVHGAENRQAAEELAKMLNQKLAETGQ